MFYPLSFGVKTYTNVRNTNSHGFIWHMSLILKCHPIFSWSGSDITPTSINLILSDIFKCTARAITWNHLQRQYNPDLNTERDWSTCPSHPLKSVSASKKDEYFIMTLLLVWACQLLFFPQLHNALSGLKRTVRFALFRRSMLCTFCPFKKTGPYGMINKAA